VLFLAGERPYVIDLSNDAPTRRAALVELDGLDRALLCISSPLGIELLPREQSLPLIDAYHEGCFRLTVPSACRVRSRSTARIPTTSTASSAAAASDLRFPRARFRPWMPFPACIRCLRVWSCSEPATRPPRARSR
jgi:hypothetical protein